MIRAWDVCESPLGPILLEASDQGLTGVSLPADVVRRDRPAGLPASNEWTRQATAELAEYFAGERRSFQAPLDLHGTPFQQRVWEQVRRIPYTTTRSYAEVGRSAGFPAAAGRAVGAANGANPTAIFVPCHRVVGSSGSLCGYGGGLPAKRYLLALEGALPWPQEPLREWLRRSGHGEDALVAVRSTRILCRPECPAGRHARREGFVAFGSLAEGVRAGYRPCRVCRPGGSA